MTTGPTQATMGPTCPYCKAATTLTNGHTLYGREDLRGKNFWWCPPCSAWVGCHAGTTKPFGSLANEPLRGARRRAHAAFDALWQEKSMSAEWQAMRRRHVPPFIERRDAYAWLGKTLAIDPIHIGEADEALCEKIVALCRSHGVALNKQIGLAKARATRAAKKQVLVDEEKSLPDKAAALARLLEE